MEPAVEAAARPDQEVTASGQSLNGRVAKARVFRTNGRVVGYNDHQIVVAIGPSVAACCRTEEINPLRTINVYKTTYDLNEKGILRRRYGCP
jgi:hypothetical protein